MVYFPTWKIALIFFFITLGVVFSSPNLFSKADLEQMPPGFPTQQINLGLDLQGGAHLVFETEYRDVIRKRMVSVQDDIRTKLRGTAQSRIGFSGLTIVEAKDADGNTADTDLYTVRVRITDAGDMSEALKRIREVAQPVQGVGFGMAGMNNISVSQGDEGLVTVRMTEPAITQLRENTVKQSIEVIRRRIDGLGTLEPTIQQQGLDRIIVQVPGETDPQRIIDLIGKTAQMNFHMHDDRVSAEDMAEGRIPPGSKIYKFQADPNMPDDFEGFERQLVLKERVLVSGDSLVNASPSFDQRSGAPVVTFRFDNKGALAFGKATANNVGRRFAIVLDNEIISAPVIQEPIMGGSGQIQGNFTVQSANDLAILLNAGALPAPLTVLEQRVVSATLGQDSIDSGKWAAIYGFIAVMIFMMLVYGLFGAFANVALITNLILIGGALSFLQATLTLPGIAGIVLTIGMAVDANVLIFERIKEEIRSGKTPINAIEAGYQRAYSAILDANITTFIAAGILFYFGSGPVRGFSVTLAIGIVTSVFTAFTFTRFLVASWYRARQPKTLPLGVVANEPAKAAR